MKRSASYDNWPGPQTNWPPLFMPDGRSIASLAEVLATDLAGTAVPVGQIFERHSADKLYVMSNYRE